MSGLSPIGPGAAAGQTMTLPPQLQTALQQSGWGAIQGSNNLPQAQQLTNNIVNNPYAAQLQGGAATAANMGATGAQNEFSAGQNLLNQAPNLFSAGNQVFNTALDPQQQLYNRYLQNTEQQFQATNALSGVGSTPYAAGLNAQNLQNFNISWNAQQLQNQIAGLNAMGGAYSTGTGMTQAGAGLQAQAPLQYLQSQGLPFNTYNQIQGSGLGALQNLQTYGTGNLNQNLGLLGMQPQLAGAQNQTAQTQAALQQQMIQQLGGGIAGLAGLGLAPFTGGSSLGLLGLGGMGGGGGFGGLSGLFGGGGGLGLQGNQGWGYLSPNDAQQDFMQDEGF